MRNLKKQIKKQVLIICLLICSSVLGLKAQSHLTAELGITPTDLLNTISAGGVQDFNIERTKLKAVSADCFVITASFTAANFSLVPVGSREPVFNFNVQHRKIYEIGVFNDAGKKRWYITRPTNTTNIGKNIFLTYDIYDDLGVDGVFTFILGHYFTAIAVDVSSLFITPYKLSPVFFGMDSNVGRYLDDNMGVLTGERDDQLGKVIYCKHVSNIYKMALNISRESKMQSIINILKVKGITDGGIINAKAGGPIDDAVLLTAPADTSLISKLQLYPNPSDGRFTVKFSLKENRLVSIKIHDLSGRLVFERNNVPYAKGTHTYEYDRGVKLPPGTYMVKVSSAEFSKSLKLIVHK